MSERYVVKRGTAGLQWALAKHAMGKTVEYRCGCEWDPLHMMSISNFMATPLVYYFRVKVEPSTLVELHEAGATEAWVAIGVMANRGGAKSPLWFWDCGGPVKFEEALCKGWYAEKPKGDENE